MTLNLSLTFEDQYQLWNLVYPARIFKDERWTGRFASNDRALPSETAAFPELIFNLSEFDSGSLIWCESAADALLTKKIHIASNYTSYILFDKESEQFVVITSWDYKNGYIPDNSDSISIEMVVMSTTSDSLTGDEYSTLIEPFITKNNGSVLGAADYQGSDHSSHFHHMLRCEINLAVRDIDTFFDEITNSDSGYKLLWRVLS